MKDLIILNEIAPVIDCNFEEVKNDLSIRLEDYKKLVVTEDSLSFCKNEQKHLAGLRKKIEDYRKKTKKNMSEPIKVFEDKCKELVDLIATTEIPLKKGIQVFDNAKKEAKREYAWIEIQRIAKELMLEEKYFNRIIFNEKWTNLTAAEKDVSSEIYNQIELLVVKQENYKHLVTMANILIDKENETLINKLSVDDFLNEDNFSNEIDSIDKIASYIKYIAQERRDFEEFTYRYFDENNQWGFGEIRNIEKPQNMHNKADEIEQQIKDKENKTAVVENVDEPSPIEIPKEKIFTYNMKISGNLNNLKLLKQFMFDNNIQFECEREV